MSITSSVANKLVKKPVRIAAKALAGVADDGARLAGKLESAGDVLLRSGNDKRFAQLQAQSGGEYTRALYDEWGTKIMGKQGSLTHKVDELWFGGKVIYQNDVTRKAPRKVKGAVFHQHPSDKANLVGSVNLNSGSQKGYDFFDNKLKEAGFLQEHAPGSIARSEGMVDILAATGLKRPAPNATAAEKKAFLDSLQAKLHERYPEGFFVKGLNDCNTGGNMATNKSNFSQLFDGYHNDYLPKQKALLAADPAVDLVPHLRAHPAAAGRTVDQILRDPRKVMVQERLKLARWTDEKLPIDVQPFQEFRVHVVDGHVVPGATSHRWSVAETFKSADEMAKVEAWTEAQFQKFPANIQHAQGFAPDVAKLEDGTYRFIELNVGGQSGILLKNPLAAAAVSEAITGHAAPIRKLSNPVGKVAKEVGDTLQNAFQGIARRLQGLGQ